MHIIKIPPKAAIMAIIMISISMACYGQQADDSVPANPMNVALQPPLPKVNQPAAMQIQNKITLDIKGMDILDVLKLISKTSGLNIVASKDVRGPVTLFLKDVPVSEAFEVVISANGLAYERSGNIINVMTEREYQLMYGTRFNEKTETKIVPLKYAKAPTLGAILNQAKTPIGKIIADEASNTVLIVDTPASTANLEKIIAEIDMPTRTEVITLNYAKAEDVKEKITDMVTKGIGMVQVDERTNKVVVVDLESKLADIRNVISELDEKSKEVLIEAKIVQISLNDEYKFGINWDAIFGGTDPQIGVDMQNIASSILPTGGLGTPLGGAVRVGQLSHHFLATIKALGKLGTVNILSTPRIVTLNNQEAKILVGKNQPYAVSTTTVPSAGNPVTSYEITYLDLGIKLYVTPTINKDKYITMKIRPEVSSSTEEVEYGQYADKIPVVRTSQAETTVMVKDGTTVIIAGLMESRDEATVNKVPFFGDIPLLGMLFRSTEKGSKDEAEKTELVIFLTPHIVSGDQGFTGEEYYSPDTFPSSVAVDTALNIDSQFPELKPVTNLDYSEYYSEVRDKIYDFIYTKSGMVEGIAGEVTASFRLESSGYLMGEPYIVKQSDALLGDVILECIKDASPFNPFPPGFDKNDEVFSITVSFE